MVSAVRSDVALGSRDDSGVHLLKTACGKSVAGYYAGRDESYEGDLCPGCYTKYELREARRLLAIAQGDQPTHAPMQTDLDREEARRRLSTGRFPRLAVVEDIEDKKEKKP